MEELQSQLDQMKFALQMAGDEDKAALEIIISDLENLIKSYDTTNNAELQSESGPSTELDEYSRFQAEIAALEPDSSDAASSSICNDTLLNESETHNKTNCISDELAALEGLRCMAPHEESWGQIGFYPAMISQVVSNTSENNENEESNAMDSIMVRIAFLQPVVKSQLLCPFFKDDRCRFSDDDCRFSHGEIVPLSSLRESIEPDYSEVIPSARVLAKYSDGLWYNATVLRLTSDGNCEVEFDKNREVVELEIHDTAPITNTSSSSSSDDESIEDEDDIELNTNNSNSCPPSLLDSNEILKMTGNESLGDWEKHTKGFGSKLMAKMGYVMGSGLGRMSEGRIIPVEAVIVPQGMSLDTWMEIKENSGGKSNRFNVEKKLKRAQKKHSNKEKQLSQNKKPKSVFDFINSNLRLRKSKKMNSSVQIENMNKQSSTHLNKKMLHVGESLRKVNKDIVKIRQSMKRIEGRDASTFTLMKEKLKDLEQQKIDLCKLEDSVIKEQKNRSDKKKLTEF